MSVKHAESGPGPNDLPLAGVMVAPMGLRSSTGLLGALKRKVMKCQ
jgi:hypothetical protein